MQENNKNLFILYGSQTGNAQDLAERTWRTVKNCTYLNNIYLCSLDDFNLTELDDENNRDNYALIICSTTGQGDVPDNMTHFWKLIMRRNLPTNCLEKLNFFLLGMGDSSYEKYNFVAKKLYKRLIQLGANALLDLCLCDNQQSDGYESMYKQFMKNVFLRLNIDFVERNVSMINIYSLEYVNDELTVVNGIDEDDNIDIATEEKPYYAQITKNERMTSVTHWQDVRLIEFDCKNTKKIAYNAGDVLMIKPKNINAIKERFLTLFSHLNLDIQKKIRFKLNYENEINVNFGFKQVITINELIESILDLNSVPRQSFFEKFSQLSTDSSEATQIEREKLLEFLQPEYKEDLYDYCYRPRRTILEVFADFPYTTANITSLESLINLIPFIKPRAFSIASSPALNGGLIQILVAVVTYKTRLYEPRLGTCSNWLASLDPTYGPIKAAIWIKKGTFNSNWSISSKPIICIGPGTGVAPFRSIINERITKHEYNENYLFFGCRSKSADFYFEHEWLNLANRNQMRLFTAFSRDQERKVYVQDVLLDNSELVYDLILNRDATVYIAGSSKRMPQDVLETIRKIIEIHTTQNDEKKTFSENYMKILDSTKRIQMETWS